MYLACGGLGINLHKQRHNARLIARKQQQTLGSGRAVLRGCDAVLLQVGLVEFLEEICKEREEKLSKQCAK